MNSDGTFTYTPPVGYDNRTDSFRFQITDGTNTTLRVGNDQHRQRHGLVRRQRARYERQR